MSLKEAIKETQIVTASGRYFDIFNPDPRDIDIRDIAHSLSNQCRFTGHTKRFYSVAQHSVLVSQNVANPRFALASLLHDASEAYLSDLARPVKQFAHGLGEAYLEIEEGIMEAVRIRFGLPDMPWPEVKKADDLLLRTEARDLMPETFPLTSCLQEPGNFLDQRIIPVAPDVAQLFFMDRFMEVA